MTGSYTTDMDGFIENGTGSPEGDRWLDSMLRLCMTITERAHPSGGTVHISVSRRDDRERLSSVLHTLIRGTYQDMQINRMILSRVLSMSSGTDRAVEGGALIDFPRVADHHLLVSLADIYDRVSDRIERADAGSMIIEPLFALSRRHLLGPVLLCRNDWGDPERFISECATGYTPVSLVCPDAEDHGYEGPIVDCGWLHMLATVEDESLHLYLNMDGFGASYNPVAFAGCSLYAAHPDSDDYHGTFGMDWYLITAERLLCMKQSEPIHDLLWMMPMTARTVDMLRKRTRELNYDATLIMGGIRLEDIFHAVSGQLRPAEVEWLLCDVDWDWRPQAKDVMAVLTGMEDSLDPGAWHRVSWPPLATAIRDGDARAAVTAMHAFRMAFSGVFPRTMLSMTGKDGAKRIALAATIPDPSSSSMIGDMLQGALPEQFVREDIDASGHTALLVFPHIEGGDTVLLGDRDCAYFEIPATCEYFGISAISESDDDDYPSALRITLGNKGVEVDDAVTLHP